MQSNTETRVLRVHDERFVQFGVALQVLKSAPAGLGAVTKVASKLRAGVESASGRGLAGVRKPTLAALSKMIGPVLSAAGIPAETFNVDAAAAEADKKYAVATAFGDALCVIITEVTRADSRSAFVYEPAPQGVSKSDSAWYHVVLVSV
jgi:hypothetical protein